MALATKSRRWGYDRVQEATPGSANIIEAPVETFNGEFKWLSNFYWSSVTFEGMIFPSMEHAFQAAKLKDTGARRLAGFADKSLSFKDAKRRGRDVALREDWKTIREDVMAACLASKFEDSHLKSKLIATGSRELWDGHWGSPDLIWGYHYPSEAGENRLGQLLMDLREKLQRSTRGPSTPVRGSRIVALYHLDWPLKCLHDGLPYAYRERICSMASQLGLHGILAVLPKLMICIALEGDSSAVDNWEHRMRNEAVDVNSRGKPCKERMLVQLMRQGSNESSSGENKFGFSEVGRWADLQGMISSTVALKEEAVRTSLGPEPPLLPSNVQYTPNREGVILNGKHFPLCLNDNDAYKLEEPLLGNADDQFSHGAGHEVPLVYEGKPSIFGGRFARSLGEVLSAQECTELIALAEEVGFGLAGSRGFNPFARFALRCLIDAPSIAAALTARLHELLPKEYPANSGRRLAGINERLRFLKYTPGMHHSGDHTDCAHDAGEHGRSFLTVQLYLNSGFSGGRTTFISNRLVPIEPSPGTLVVFDHELYHRGGQVTQGTKYAIRMDVLYSNPQSSAQPPSSYYEAPPTSKPLQSNGRRRWKQQ